MDSLGQNGHALVEPTFFRLIGQLVERVEILPKHQFNACGECADGTLNSAYQIDCGKQHKRLCWNVIINT